MGIKPGPDSVHHDARRESKQPNGGRDPTSNCPQLPKSANIVNKCVCVCVCVCVLLYPPNYLLTTYPPTKTPSPNPDDHPRNCSLFPSFANSSSLNSILHKFLTTARSTQPRTQPNYPPAQSSTRPTNAASDASGARRTHGSVCLSVRRTREIERTTDKLIRQRTKFTTSEYCLPHLAAKICARRRSAERACLPGMPSTE